MKSLTGTKTAVNLLKAFVESHTAPHLLRSIADKGYKKRNIFIRRQTMKKNTPKDWKYLLQVLMNYRPYRKITFSGKA